MYIGGEADRSARDVRFPISTVGAHIDHRCYGLDAKGHVQILYRTTKVYRRPRPGP